jgi:hypothetical protein
LTLFFRKGRPVCDIFLYFNVETLFIRSRVLHLWYTRLLLLRSRLLFYSSSVIRYKLAVIRYI